ncbi:ABC transporter permease [Streptomyces marincola]|uniref:ABC transporter permease n=1 Tax=Streptomyces marincola TaxID=2878388 RepID=UPI001CF17E31|nr:ABC transporter permease [Streptomyces marincola]UCM87356.1 ABC transporter permease [Streptomyces marincola]
MSDWGREIRTALLVALPLTLATGLVLGLVWLWRAPRVPLVSDGRAVLLANSEGQAAIGADGTFLLAGLLIGLPAGVVVFLLRRDGGVGVPLGVAAGALAGAWLAWRTGVWLGPGQDVAARAREAGVGVEFDAPLDLGARGVLLGLPFAAVGVHLLCQAVWGPRDPQSPPAQPPHWPAGPAPHGPDAQEPPARGPDTQGPEAPGAR